MLQFTEKTVAQSLQDIHLLVDFERDAFANLAIEASLQKAGTIEFCIGEVLLPEGKLDRNPGGFRTFRAMVRECEKGTSHFSFEIPVHRSPYAERVHVKAPCPADAEGELAPFRYVQICGAQDGDFFRLRRREVFGPCQDEDADFQCGNITLNRLWDMCKYTIKATSAFGLFIDGERERLPYEGDSLINQLGFFCCTPDSKVPRDTLNWLFKYPTWPMEWNLLMPQLVKDYLLYTGDIRSVNQWLTHLEKCLLPQLLDDDGLLRDDDRIQAIVDWPPTERDDYQFGNVNFVPNCYYYGALCTMAELTGENRYQIQAGKVRKSIYRIFFQPETGLFQDSSESTHSSLHSAFFPLYFQLAEQPAPLKQCILGHGLDCSVYGAHFLLEVCYRHGLGEHALHLMTKGGLRSWQNMLEKGATMTMEAWDDSLKPNQDWNHAWGAAPAGIIPRFLCGVRPVLPGFRKFIVDPQPALDGPIFLKHPTPHGPILLERDQQNHWLLAVPDCTTALFHGRELSPGKHQLSKI